MRGQLWSNSSELGDANFTVRDAPGLAEYWPTFARFRPLCAVLLNMSGLAGVGVLESPSGNPAIIAAAKDSGCIKSQPRSAHTITIGFLVHSYAGCAIFAQLSPSVLPVVAEPSPCAQISPPKGHSRPGFDSSFWKRLKLEAGLCALRFVCAPLLHLFRALDRGPPPIPEHDRLGLGLASKLVLAAQILAREPT